METEKRVETTIRLDAKRDITLQGVVKEERKIFGRNEVLIEVDKMDPLWITKEKVRSL